MSRPTDAGLVPLADRFRYLTGFRVVVALAVLAAWALAPATRGSGGAVPVVLLVAYPLVGTITLRFARLRRSVVMRALGLVLLLDAVWLAAVTYASTGLGTPLQYAVLLHLVAVTLLASFRSGVKLALWHSLLVTSVTQLQHDHLLRGPAAPVADVVLFLAVLWIGTLLTAAFAAVNERELRRRNYDLQALARLAWQLESTLDAAEVGDALLRAVAEDFDAARLVLLVRGPDGLVPLSADGLADADGSAADDRMIAQALREHRTLRVAAPEAADHPWLARAMPTAGNVLCLPLFADSAPLGVLVVERNARAGDRIERRAVEMLERFVSQASLALANARLLAQVRALAAADGLTGVANRRAFDNRLAEEIARSTRNRSPLSLVLLDVDHFKRLNDTYGHQTGDEALRRVAATVTASARVVDLVARYGGEEFVLLLPDTDLTAASDVAERLRGALAAMPGEPALTVSMGVSAFPSTALSGTDLVACADAALYAAKQAGRNRVAVTGRRSPSSPADIDRPAVSGVAERR